MRGEVEPAQRGDRHMLEHPVDRQVGGAARRAVEMRQAARRDFLEGRVVALHVRVDLEEHRLAARILLGADGEVGAEFLRRQMGGDERLRIEREIEVDFHDDCGCRVGSGPDQAVQSTPRMSPCFRNCSCMRKTVERVCGVWPPLAMSK